MRELNDLQQKRINMWIQQAEKSNLGVKEAVMLDEMLTNIVETIDYNQNISYFPRLLNQLLPAKALEFGSDETH